MSPERVGGLAYWASGGSVVARRGPTAMDEALALLDFLDHGTSAGLAADAAAERFCEELALELHRAIVAAAGWRRAASGLRHSL